MTQTSNLKPQTSKKLYTLLVITTVFFSSVDLRASDAAAPATEEQHSDSTHEPGSVMSADDIKKYQIAKQQTDQLFADAAKKASPVKTFLHQNFPAVHDFLYTTKPTPAEDASAPQPSRWQSFKDNVIPEFMKPTLQQKFGMKFSQDYREAAALPAGSTANLIDIMNGKNLETAAATINTLPAKILKRTIIMINKNNSARLAEILSNTHDAATADLLRQNIKKAGISTEPVAAEDAAEEPVSSTRFARGGSDEDRQSVAASVAAAGSSPRGTVGMSDEAARINALSDEDEITNTIRKLTDDQLVKILNATQDPRTAIQFLNNIYDAVKVSTPTIIVDLFWRLNLDQQVNICSSVPANILPIFFDTIIDPSNTELFKRLDAEQQNVILQAVAQRRQASIPASQAEPSPTAIPADFV